MDEIGVSGTHLYPRLSKEKKQWMNPQSISSLVLRQGLYIVALNDSESINTSP